MDPSSGDVVWKIGRRILSLIVAFWFDIDQLS